MKRRDEPILDALDREIAGEAAGEELRQLRRLAGALRNLGSVEAPEGFTGKVMAALPERRRSWLTRLKELFMRPHIVRLNLAWEAGLAAAVVAVALLGQGWGPVQPQQAEATPLVHTRFTVKAPDAKAVTVAGDFNNWRNDQCQMIKAEADDVWTITVPLKPGRYKYMFIVDGQKWQTDPLAEAYEQDGYGYKNAVVDVPGPEQGQA